MTPGPDTQLAANANDAERHQHHVQRKEVLGTLASGMAHELRNIVMPVLLRLDVLSASAELPESARSDLTSIRKSMRHLQHLSEGLRLLSPDAAIQPAERPTTRLASWWADFRSVVVDTLPMHASVSADFPETLPLVAVPQSVLAQAVMSLILDALPAVATVSHPSLRLYVTEDDDVLRLSVEKNFRRFEPTPDSRAIGLPTRSHRDTSMRFGLYASRELLNQYGGDLIREVTDEHVQITITLRRVTPLGTHPAQRIRVLVEDQRVLAVVRLLMQQRGISAVEPNDLGPVDLIICDAGTLPLARHSISTSPGVDVVVLGAKPADGPELSEVRWLDVSDVGALFAAFG